MRFILIITAIIVSIGFFSYSPGDSKADEINNYYLQLLDSLKVAVKNFQEINSLNNNTDQQKSAFKEIRLAYKKLSVITDLLNPYETILLNSPALKRTEDDNPTNIIEPHGLQQLEQLLWQNEITDESKAAIKNEIGYINEVIEKLENEHGRINKFNNEMIWQAMRTSLITLITKTITGFDSPITLNSIPECKATLESLQTILGIYKPILNYNAPGYFDKINKNITDVLAMLEHQKDFKSFDRLSFIKTMLNPLSDNLTEAAIALKYIRSNERIPLDPLARNLFAKNVFDVNFFSPNSRYQFTKERMLLGKKLFNDPNLSGNGTRSCATCHKPELAFTDGLATALSIDNKTFLNRNTPTLLNAVFQTKQFYDSRATMLEFQVNSVVHNTREMGGSTEQMATMIKKDKNLAAQFTKAYPDDKEPVSRYTIANAIASYMRSLQAMNTRFDQYMRNEPVIFTVSEKNGFNLFMGKAKCGTCHFMPLFNGLVPPQFNDTESEILGVPSSLKNPYQLDSDSGKYYFTKSIVHLYAFKTPTLRNVTLTAPYMHNGVYKTLEQVIDFYNKGGGKGLGIAPENQSLPFDKLELTKKEKKDIIHFLETLVDTTSYKID